MSSSRSVLPLQAAVSLAHTLVAVLAQRQHLRVLSIKGFTLEAHDLRHAHQSSDADVWCDPETVELLQAELKARGWLIRPEREVPSIVSRHSVSWYHPKWPCDIDVHTTFPGIFIDDKAAFEIFWTSHDTNTLCGRTIEIPSVVNSLFIGVLHCLRHPHSPRHQAELTHYRSILAQDSALARDFITLAENCRSLAVVGDWLISCGVFADQSTIARLKHSDEYLRWQLYRHTHEQGSTAAWILAITQGPWTRRLRYLGRSLFPRSTDIVDVRHPMTRRERLSYRVHRFFKATAALPNSLRNVVAYRRKLKRFMK